ncbi:MAG TPA: hypothetical protein VF261_02560 [Candidatus Saccharimonadales bacterium]
MLKFKRLTALAIVSLLSMCWLAAVVPPSAHADSVANQAVTQGYGSDSPLQLGMLVRLDTKDPTKVEPLTQDTASQMQGVVVAANSASVTLSDNSNKGQVFVASFGHYDVLVSNQNGPIKPGDYISISSLAGVGMKADASQSVVVGKAAAGFDGTSNVQGTTTVKNSAGQSVTVSFGRIPVNISISHNPLQQDVDNNLPGFLRKASLFIANKPVSSVRVYISLVVLLVTAILAGSLLYGGVRNGLIAIGRNPLAKKSITRNLFQVIFTSLIVFVVGLFAVYLLLRL